MSDSDVLAFPSHPALHSTARQGDAKGMTLRDYFAAQALAGLCANPGGPFQANSMSGWAIVNCTTDHIAQECYRLADSMLAGRQGEG